ncbi:MAG: DUF992 domain-containing protein [Proteobacteria bacterium]|nr:DUF992 domain-containing protein [Pseudomonadota bacterium]
MSSKRIVLTIPLMATLLAMAAAADNAKPVVGTLTCKGKPTVGLIIGSKQTFTCSFNPTGKAPPQMYRGAITKFGLDLGVKGATVLVWTVLGSTGQIPAGALAGKYAGVSADASVGIGAGANALVGGSKNSVVLQPLSVQGQAGVNLAVGVSGLVLQTM